VSRWRSCAARRSRPTSSTTTSTRPSSSSSPCRISCS
jgi:hypothetical protein